jgi:hypothetical protein
MQHIYIVKHDRATVKRYRYTLQINYTFLSMIYISCRVGASCETSQRVGLGIRIGRIQLQNRSTVRASPLGALHLDNPVYSSA